MRSLSPPHRYARHAQSVERDVAILGKLDLVLLHWPCATLEQTLEAYSGLEAALANGLTRAIGVSNFNASLLAVTVSGPNPSPCPSHPSPIVLPRLPIPRQCCPKSQSSLQSISAATQSARTMRPTTHRSAAMTPPSPSVLPMGYHTRRTALWVVSTASISSRIRL